MKSRHRKVIILSAPSGAGKTTLVRYLLEEFAQLALSVSATTRTMREGEKDGYDYYFLSEEEFRTRLAGDQFVEWEEVYTGTLYGTLRSEIERLWNEEKVVIFDVDVRGGLNLKAQFGKDSKLIFIEPPSIDTLRKRLEERGKDTPKVIQERLQRAEYELSQKHYYDVRVINDNLDIAKENLKAIVKKFLSE
jgi:guanylate kinase